MRYSRQIDGQGNLTMQPCAPYGQGDSQCSPYCPVRCECPPEDSTARAKMNKQWAMESNNPLPEEK